MFTGVASKPSAPNLGTKGREGYRGKIQDLPDVDPRRHLSPADLCPVFRRRLRRHDRLCHLNQAMLRMSTMVRAVRMEQQLRPTLARRQNVMALRTLGPLQIKKLSGVMALVGDDIHGVSRE